MNESETIMFVVWEQGTGELTDSVKAEAESPRQAAFFAASGLDIGYREALLCVRPDGSDAEPLVYRVEPRRWFVVSDEPVNAAGATAIA